jgi:curved DNA-binding protein CbpA
VKDYYSILGVHRNASEAEIKRAYRRLAVIYHPDKNKDPQAQEIFVAITEAYDVVGDPAKRQAYHQRMENPFAEVLVEEPIIRHRDPAYRRRRPVTSPPPPRTSEAAELMKEYLHYFYWMSWVGLGIISLFFLDFLLPYSVKVEKVEDVSAVRFRRGIAYFNATTESGDRFKIYPDADLPAYNDATIRWSKTLIYGTAMWLEPPDGTDRFELAYMYKSFIYIPLGLFITSLFAIFFRRRRVDLCFNFSFVSGVFIVFFWIFL